MIRRLSCIAKPGIAKNMPIRSSFQLNYTIDSTLFCVSYMTLLVSRISNFYMSICTRFYILIHNCKFFFISHPLMGIIPERVQILFFIIRKYLFVLLLSKLLFSIGYLLMDDLTRAVVQFCPSLSGGMSGSSSPPPAPGPIGNFELVGPSIADNDNASNPPALPHSPSLANYNFDEDQDLIRNVLQGESSSQHIEEVNSQAIEDEYNRCWDRFELIIEKRIRKYIETKKCEKDFPNLDKRSIDCRELAIKIVSDQKENFGNAFDSPDKLNEYINYCDNQNNIRGLIKEWLDD